ncbi:MAG: 50S ribosomal protein L6 [Halobacteriales archaeon]
MPRIELPVPDEVDASVDGTDLRVDGPEGTVERPLWYPGIEVAVVDDAIVIEAAADDRSTNAVLGTFESHVENMLHGVTEGWEYRMKTVYAHFPMQVSVQDGEVVIENFLGERAPRRTDVVGDTEVAIEGDVIVLRGPDKEAVGQTAAAIEQLTRVSGKDVRVFQDGVYITEKPRGGLAHE